MNKGLRTLAFAGLLLTTLFLHVPRADAQETFAIDPVTVSASQVANIQVTVTNPLGGNLYTIQLGIMDAVNGCQRYLPAANPTPSSTSGGTLVLTDTPQLDAINTFCVEVLRGNPVPINIVWASPQTFTGAGSISSGGVTLTPQDNTASAPNSNGCTSNDTQSYCALAPIPGIGDSTGKIDFTTCPAGETGSGGFGCYVNAIIKVIFGIIGVFSVIMIIVSGVEIMTGDSADEKSTGKKRLGAALFGLVIALGSYVFLNTLNPNLVNLTINLPSKTLIYDNSAFQQSEFSASPTTETSLAPSNLSSSGYMCPGSGGSAVIPGVLGSLQGKVTYRFGGGHSQNQPPYSQDTYMCPAGSGTSCSSFCPAGQLCLDCSSFVDTVLKCAGLSSPGGGTGTLFSSGAGAEKVQGDITYDGSTPVINGIALKDGDLVGWLAGENGDDTGHVLIYSEGMIYDSHGGNNGRIAGKATGGWPFSKYAGEIEHVYRTH